ncbi:MAG: serine/threonine protein kinase, partial [Alphaproteobacteria bacterium]|nr:serine/threonine protein kinase [Alphaproteobacteria bacterium]
MSASTETTSRVAFGPLIGRGGFGDVYLATLELPSGLRRKVAVKVLRADLPVDARAAERLEEEARNLARVDAPAIVGITEFTRLDGRLALVMEHVPGLDLTACLRLEPALPARAALEIVRDVAHALHLAHVTPGPDGRPLGLVHRDIKPCNLRITPDGRVRLLDLGLARGVGSPDVTRELGAIGTPGYLSPEVLAGSTRRPGQARDVFALGCTLFAALARRPLFEDVEIAALVGLAMRPEAFADHVRDALASLPPLPAEIVGLLAAMLDHSPRRRPTALRVADRADALLARAPGPGLYAWCRSVWWPAPDDTPGELTGRTILSRVGVTPAAPVASGSTAARGRRVVLALAFLSGLTGTALAGAVVATRSHDRAAPTPGPSLALHRKGPPAGPTCGPVPGGCGPGPHVLAARPEIPPVGPPYVAVAHHQASSTSVPPPPRVAIAAPAPPERAAAPPA